jgi:hypothetical protein
MPVGKLHELQTKSDENEKGEKGGEAEKGENDDNGDDDVHHTYAIPKATPPTLDEAGTPPPLSTPLGGRRTVVTNSMRVLTKQPRTRTQPHDTS